jgi:hypothetical protein
MKKHFILALLSICALAFAGCGPDEIYIVKGSHHVLQVNDLGPNVYGRYIVTISNQGENAERFDDIILRTDTFYAVGDDVSFLRIKNPSNNHEN